MLARGRVKTKTGLLGVHCPYRLVMDNPSYTSKAELLSLFVCYGLSPSGYKSVLKCSTNPIATEKSKMLAPKHTSMVFDAQTSTIVRRMLENIYLTFYEAEALLCTSLVNDVFYGYVLGTYVSNVLTENEKDLFRNHLSAM